MRVLFIIPGDINLPTGGYRYDREIISAWRQSGVNVELVSLQGNYPFPNPEEEKLALEIIQKLPCADVAVVDGLLGGSAPEFIQRLSEKIPVASLIHHPLCLENGLDEKSANSLKKSEKRGLEFTSLIITTSPTTRKTVAELFKRDEKQIHTVLPGVERGTQSAGSQSACLNLLCVGSVIERKGHKDLLLALGKLKHLDWQLDCIGSTAFDEILFAELQALSEQLELDAKVGFHGDVSEDVLSSFYKRADLFVLPSLFEGYGMAYAEAIVRGIPVIGTTAGAIPETVPSTCGILVEPSNVNALTQALEGLISDDLLRAQYRIGALTAEPDFPTWQSSATQFAEMLKEIV